MKFADTKSELQLSKLRQRQGNNLREIKKAVKLTFIILAALLLCFTPLNVAKIVLLSYHSDIVHITHEALVMFFFFSLSLSFFNSLLNPVIYALRVSFRV